MWKLIRCRDHRGVINFFHDCEERLRKVHNENWESYDFTLDAAGYVIAESGFDGAVSKLSDKVGNLYNDPDKKLRKHLEGDRENGGLDNTANRQSPVGLNNKRRDRYIKAARAYKRKMISAGKRKRKSYHK